MTQPVESEQSKLWNGFAGRAWVDAQEVLDRMMKPFEDLLVDAVSAASGKQVLDIGCGTGSTTVAVARRLGEEGGCLGVDISQPMIEAARARADRDRVAVDFMCADVQTHTFNPARFDVVISRFGVMFFDDPVQAFANVRRAAKPGARLHFVAWRGAEENLFMTTAERAAAPLLPGLAPRQPNAPGQFAFADQRRVRSILQDSGWVDIDIQPIDVACTLREPELNRYLARLGPVGRALQEVDAQTGHHVMNVVRAAFDPFVRGAEVQFTAACWSVGARAASGPVKPEPTTGR